VLKISLIYDYLRTLILPLVEIDKFVPKSNRIYDLGCGEGVISRYLARIKTREIIGVDNSEKRLKKTNFKNLRFILTDIRTFDLNKAGGVVISDVLHHLNFNDQAKLLRNVYKKLNKNGVLVVKEIDREEFIRSRLSRFWDFILYPKDKICYYKSTELKNFLTSLGFNVKVVRTSRFFPGSTTLFLCRK